MSSYLEDADLTLCNGDALEVLRTLPSGSVQMCVTSPPFYGLRDYGTGSWTAPVCEFDGFDMEPTECGWICRRTAEHPSDRAWEIDAHEHEGDERWYTEKSAASDSSEAFSEAGEANAARLKKARWREAGICRCGARRVDQQIGLEETPEQWVAKLVDVFREVRRVLRADGTLWVEVGDSYASPGGRSVGRNDSVQGREIDGKRVTSKFAEATAKAAIPGYKQKDLIGAPWMLAFALRADGWYLRSDVVWSRPNPMPESVTDRPTKSHSYVFLLSKSARYFFDAEAVREDVKPWNEGRMSAQKWDGMKAMNGGRGQTVKQYDEIKGANVRSVWTIATQPHPEAHFATYPEELVRRCILAGTSERGCCPKCGAPWAREIIATGAENARNRVVERDFIPGKGGNASGVQSLSGATYKRQREVGDWRPSCGCRNSSGGTNPPVPCTVLDPFFGSGTTGLVARKHDRRTIGIELSASYCELAARRLQQLSLFA